MGCKKTFSKILKPVNPENVIKQSVATTKSLAKGEFQGAYRHSAELSPVQTKLDVTEDYSKRGLKNPYIAEGAAFVADVYAPGTGAVVRAAAAREQGKVAKAKAAKESARVQAAFENSFAQGLDDLGGQINEGLEALAPDEDPDADKAVRKRFLNRQRTKTLLSLGTGGGDRATLSRPALLGV